MSTPGVRFGCIDIKNMYYGKPMKEYNYMKVKMNEIPIDVIKHYNLNSLVHTDGYVYMEIRKGMPGLKQAGKNANNRLNNHLVKYGYRPCHKTPALWKHNTNNVIFALVVDDFGVKYKGEHEFNHLIGALQSLYIITIDRTGSKKLASASNGITLKATLKSQCQDMSTKPEQNSNTESDPVNKIHHTNKEHHDMENNNL